MWVFLFLILTHCGKNHIPFTLVNFGISQFVSDGPKENILVYNLLIKIVTTVNLVATGLLTICAKKETIIVDQISKGASFITHSSKATLIFAILQVYVKNESTILCIMHSKIKIWHALLIKNNREQLNITHNNTSEV